MFLSLLLFPFLTGVNPFKKGIFYFMKKELRTPHCTREQKRLAKYKSKTEFDNALHMLLYTRGLKKVPKGVKRFIKWVKSMNANCDPSHGIGAFFHLRETIIKDLECSLSTLEKAITWLKRHGLLHIELTWDDANDKPGNAYFVFAPIQDFKTMVHALVKQDEALAQKTADNLYQENEIVRKFTDAFTGAITDAETDENPITPTDEAPKNSAYIRPVCNTSIKKNINNNKYNTPYTHDAENPQETAENVPEIRNNENRNTEKPQQSGRKAPKIDLSIIDPKTFELLKRYKHFADYPFYDNDLKLEMTFWIQRAIDKAGGEIADPDHQHVIKEAIGTVLTMYGDDKPKEELTKLMYSSVKEILEQLISGQRETAATAEKPKKKKPFWKKDKKPIRTEILPDWYDKAKEDDRKYEEIEQKQREDNKRIENDPVYAAQKQKELKELLAQLRASEPQNGASAF
jgi:hypothetical protein